VNATEDDAARDAVDALIAELPAGWDEAKARPQARRLAPVVGRWLDEAAAERC
jgi:hypothetical protein